MRKKKKKKEKDPWGFQIKGTRESLFASTSAKSIGLCAARLGCLIYLLTECLWKRLPSFWVLVSPAVKGGSGWLELRTALGIRSQLVQWPCAERVECHGWLCGLQFHPPLAVWLRASSSPLRAAWWCKLPGPSSLGAGN